VKRVEVDGERELYIDDQKKGKGDSRTWLKKPSPEEELSYLTGNTVNTGLFPKINGGPEELNTRS